jgi:hypothetical protein
LDLPPLFYLPRIRLIANYFPEPIVEPIQFRTKTFRSSITRPANTTTYAANDVYSSATSTVFVLGEALASDAPDDPADGSPFRPASVVPGSCLNNFVLTLQNNAALSLSGRLSFFTVNPATRVDNDARSFTLAEMRDSFITSVNIQESDWIINNPGAGAAGIKSCMKANIDWPEQSPAFSSTFDGRVYAILILWNAYIPVSEEVACLKATFTVD